MKKISREKAALGFFVFLALAGLGVLIAYIVTVGHSLNVAASNIDDATGNLDGYTAVLYKGTATEHRETVVNSTELGDTLSSRSLNKRSTQQDTENSSTDEVSAADTAESASGRENSEQAQPVSLFALQRSYIEKELAFLVSIPKSSRITTRLLLFVLVIIRMGFYPSIR